MKLLVIKLSLLAFLIASTCGLLFIFIMIQPIDNDSYLSEIIDKHKHLEETPSPRIIFVGGSNLPFGLHSKMIERNFKIPVVNMGIQGDLGLRYQLDEIKPFLKKTDIIIISPVYEDFYTTFNGNETLFDLIHIYPQGIRFISIGQLLTIIKNIPVFLRDGLNQFIGLSLTKNGIRHYSDDVLNRHSFNNYGDLESHYGKPSKKDIITELSKKQISGEIDRQSISYIETFINETSVKYILLSFPPIVDLYYNTNENKISNTYKALESIKNIKIIDTPQDYVYPINFFYDSYYHLTKEGGELYTKQIIQHLSNLLKSTK